MVRAALILVIVLFANRINAESFVLFEEKGKVGMKDQAGKIVIPASFDALGWSDGSFSVIGQITGYKLNGKWGVLNLQKQFITPAEFESLTYSGGDRIIASRNLNPFTVKFGAIDLGGKVMIPFNYDGIIKSGLRAIVFIKNGTGFEYGLIDLNDKGIIPLRYRQIIPIGTLRYAVENREQHMALFSEDGRQLTDFTIDSISAFHHGYAVIYQKLAQGVIDREGEIQLPARYREVQIQDGGTVIVRDFDEWKFVDEKNAEQLRLAADWLQPSGNLLQITLAGKNGLVDSNFKSVIPLTYDFLGNPQNGNRAAANSRKYGVVRPDNSFILPLTFDSILVDPQFIRAMENVSGRKSWMAYDTFGIRKSASPYEWIEPYNGKFFPVKKRGFWGAMNRYGEEFVNCVFDSLVEWKDNLMVVKFRGQYGIINHEDKWLLPPQPDTIHLVNDDVYLQVSNGVTFLKDFHQETIYFTSNPITPENGLLRESLPDSRQQWISLNGVVQDIGSNGGIDDSLNHQQAGLYRIKKDDKYGFVDERGRLRIANRYDDAGDFREGLAPVKLIGKWGFVDVQDRIAVNPNFESVKPFQNGFAITRRNGKEGLIDRQGKTILAFRYDHVSRLQDESFLLEITGSPTLFGLADAKGNVSIEPRYEVLKNLGNHRVIAGRDGKVGLMTDDGLSLVPMMYDSMMFDSTRNLYLVQKKAGWKSPDLPVH